MSSAVRPAAPPASRVSSPTYREQPDSREGPPLWPTRWALSAVIAIAALLRLWTIHRVPGNNFYDAAVRSMAGSWHAFFYGALTPNATIAIDKPPLDLWLQVASTEVLGYGLIGLHLPEAVGGVAACALLFGLLRRPFGTLAAFVAAMALAVLPISALSSRSDTMDSLLAALEVLAMWLSWKALCSRQARWSVLAAMTMGVAFNVKLGEALIVMPALLLLWRWAAPAAARARTLLVSCATFLVVALSWATVASLTPTSQRPYPIGSATGSIWRLIFIYNGLDRFDGHGAVGASSTVSGGGPGPGRLISTGASHYGALIGLELLAALLLGMLTVATLGTARIRTARHSPPGRLVIALVVWLACGLIVFSAMRRLQPRYLEAFTPAVCALVGLAVSALKEEARPWVTRGLAGSALLLGGYAVAVYAREPVAWLVVSLIGLLTVFVVALGGRFAPRAGKLRSLFLATSLMVCLGAAPLGWDINMIEDNHSDSALKDPTTPALSRYLMAHRDGAYFEVASANVYDIVGIVARDDLPVIMLNDVDGPTTTLNRFQGQVLTGQVRFYFAAHGCHTGQHCPSNERWAYEHSVPVGRYPGLRRFRRSRKTSDRSPVAAYTTTGR
jgi:4-amino-4-deoxy-L-arabinose transferase-like glycosyltransferase